MHAMNIWTKPKNEYIFLYFWGKNVYIIAFSGRIMLKNRRKYLWMNQKYLTEKIKVSQGFISKVERCIFSNVTVEFITKLSDEINIRSSWCFSVLLQ